MPHDYPLLARQPIFNREMTVIAYELLYRATEQDTTAQFIDGNSASSQVLLNTFAELSIEKVVGKHQAFINFTVALMDIHLLPFDTTQLVVEVLESETVNAHLLHKLKQLRENGFAIALDDFVITEHTKPLIPYADIVKLDVLALTKTQLVSHVAQLQPLGITLLAEKIETIDMFEHCMDLGFDLFQGYFLEKPKLITGQRINENKQAVLQLLAKLNDPEVEIKDIEAVVARDPVLSYKLLKLVNSAAFGLPRTIESLRQALMLLGLKIMRNWVGLLAMTKLGDKPIELNIKALTRAKLCELMAAVERPARKCDSFFTVGLLSTLDAFMDTPLEDVLEDIHLSDKLKNALLAYRGDEGQFLQAVINYEHGDWEKINWSYLAQHQLDPGKLTQLYLQTLAWVDDTQESVQAGTIL